jgi:hypothetical protein
MVKYASHTHTTNEGVHKKGLADVSECEDCLRQPYLFGGVDSAFGGSIHTS